MKRSLLFLITFLFYCYSHAQLSIGQDGLTISAGETFTYDGLSLTPGTTFTISSNTLTKTDDYTISPAPIGYYIKRYYNFSNNTPNFSGLIRFSYLGAELKGSNNVIIPEADLRLNIFNGSTWSAYADLPDQTNDFVDATNIVSVLNNMTLASVSGALPVSWLNFTAFKQTGNVVLHWSTASETNTRDFVVQHNASGNSWITLGNVKAAGNSSTKKEYSFIHNSPALGNNNYRLIQRDLDDRFSFSKVVTVRIDESGNKNLVYPNPIIEGKLNVKLQMPASICIYDVTGRERIFQKLSAGIHIIDVSALSAGLYYVKVGNETFKILIQ